MGCVTFHYYVDILKKHLSNLNFIQPKSDICRRCDAVNVLMKDTMLTEDKRCDVKMEREQHHTKSAEGYDMPIKILENT